MTLLLPCPRFELRWENISGDWTDRECIYSLVIPLEYHDIRAEDADGNLGVNTEQSLEIGRTKVSGGHPGVAPIANGVVATPFRDGVHAMWDSAALGGHIPIVAVCDGAWDVVESPRQAELTAEWVDEIARRKQAAIESKVANDT